MFNDDFTQIPYNSTTTTGLLQLVEERPKSPAKCAPSKSVKSKSQLTQEEEDRRRQEKPAEEAISNVCRKTGTRILNKSNFRITDGCSRTNPVLWEKKTNHQHNNNKHDPNQKELLGRVAIKQELCVDTTVDDSTTALALAASPSSSLSSINRGMNFVNIKIEPKSPNCQGSLTQVLDFNPNQHHHHHQHRDSSNNTNSGGFGDGSINMDTSSAIAASSHYTGKKFREFQPRYYVAYHIISPFVPSDRTNTCGNSSGQATAAHRHDEYKWHRDHHQYNHEGSAQCCVPAHWHVLCAGASAG